jgi:pimeloyl-ACP methyl ester carboxylesterase
VTYQTDADDLCGFLNAFGFDAPILLAERRGCIAATLVAAWHTAPVAGLVLIDRQVQPPCGLTGLAARGLRECPPDWSTLLSSVTASVLELQAFAFEPLKAFLDSRESPG